MIKPHLRVVGYKKEVGGNQVIRFMLQASLYFGEILFCFVFLLAVQTTAATTFSLFKFVVVR